MWLEACRGKLVWVVRGDRTSWVPGEAGSAAGCQNEQLNQEAPALVAEVKATVYLWFSS